MIITFSNHKGGVGKTTFALIVVQTLLKNNADVVCYDIDGQQNFTEQLARWAEKNSTPAPQVAKNLPGKIDHANKFVLIDTAPGLDPATEKAIKAADVIVLPVEANIASIAGLRDVAKLKTTAKILLVINKYDKTAAFEKYMKTQIESAIESAKEQGMLIKMYTIPRLKQLLTNLNVGDDWGYRMTEEKAQPILDVIKEAVKMERR